MPSALPSHLDSTARLLGHFQQAIGAPSRTTYGNECLHLLYQLDVRNIADKLAGHGIHIEANLALPGADAEEMVAGAYEESTFMARSFVSPDAGRVLDVHIYANNGKDSQRSTRLVSIYSMADALFAMHDCADQALLSYIARRLNDNKDSVATTRLCASLNSLLADYQMSTLPPIDPALQVRR